MFSSNPFLQSTFGRGSSTSVTMKRCAASGFTVAHELGHNMGALHDKVQVGGGWWRMELLL